MEQAPPSGVDLHVCNARVRRTAAVCLAFACSLGGLHGQLERTKEPSIASRIATEIATQHVHGVSRADWKRSVPAATWRDRRGPFEHPPESTLPQQRGLWCSAATDSAGAFTREAVFYGLRTEQPLDCRLEQVRYVVDDGSGADDVYADLRRAIDATLKGSEARSPTAVERTFMGIEPDSTADSSYPSDRWRDLRCWSMPAQSVLLYRFDSTVQVLTQSFILPAALREDREGYHAAAQRYGVDIGMWNLINHLRPLDPEAVDLLIDPERIPDQTRLEQVLLRLLEQRATTKRADDRAALTSAIANLAARLLVEGARPEEARPSLRPLLAHGVAMVESPYDAGVWYGAYDPRGVATRAPGPGGDLLYRDVITEHLAKIRTHRGTASSIQLFELAEAYETWWSLSLAPDDEELVTRADHAAGAATARQEAIKWYERLIREFPDSPEADRARRVIIQIRVGVDTGQRVFFSPYA